MDKKKDPLHLETTLAGSERSEKDGRGARQVKKKELNFDWTRQKRKKRQNKAGKAINGAVAGRDSNNKRRKSCRKSLVLRMPVDLRRVERGKSRERKNALPCVTPIRS